MCIRDRIDTGRAGFVDILNHVLDKYGLERRHLRLEVTETALMPDSEVANDNLKELRTQDFRISVDDFGTGYSNLAYLKHIPMTALKIDRAFAGDAHTNPVSKSIVRMLITLGRELGVDIIAEGLETEACADTLRELGCPFAQGYYFHKPMTEDAAFQLLGGERSQTAIVA